MRSISKTEMLIFQSVANLDGKILYGNITHLKDPTIRKMLGRGLNGNQDSTFYSGPKFYLLLKLKLTSETSNGIESEFQCQINHGPE